MATLKITQVRGTVRATEKQQATLRSLKLGKVRRSTEREDSPMLQGQIKAVSHLVKVETI